MDHKINVQSDPVEDSRHWLFVEYEFGETLNLVVIAADLVDHPKSIVDMSTAATVRFRRNNEIVIARVFMESADRAFIETEAKQQLELYKRQYGDRVRIMRFEKIEELNRQDPISVQAHRDPMKINDCETLDTAYKNTENPMSSLSISPRNKLTAENIYKQIESEKVQMLAERQRLEAKMDKILQNQNEIITQINRLKKQIDISDFNLTNTNVLSNKPLDSTAVVSQHEAESIFSKSVHNSLNHSVFEHQQHAQNLLMLSDPINHSCSYSSITNPATQVLPSITNDNHQANKQIDRSSASIPTETLISEKRTALIGKRRNVKNGNPSKRNKKNKENQKHRVEGLRHGNQIEIGSHGSKIYQAVLDSINWTSCTNATRAVMDELFTRTTMATRTLTGKPSPGK